MKVTRVNDVYIASRITGPKHNYLGLVLSIAPPIHTVVTQRMLDDGPGVVNEQQLVAAVTAGIDEANRSRVITLFAHSIEYVSSDTPDYAAYSLLAKTITDVASADFA